MNPAIIDSAVRLPSQDGKIQTKTWFGLAEEWGITHSVVAPSDELVAVYNEEGNRQMIELVRQYRKRISGLAVANPWYGKKAVAMLEKAFEQGLSGLYLHPARQGFRLTESILHPLIEVCIQHDRPIYSHTGTPICAMPFQLAEVARAFPKARFIMGHTAWSDFWYDVIPAAQQVENLYVETSCTTGDMVEAIIKALGTDRVLFGTGYPKSHPRYEFEKIKMVNFPTESRKKYLRDNAMRLWKIEE